MESLKKVERYVEVDVESLNNYKAKKLEELKAEPLCTRQVISMDFSKESTKDMPNHGFDPSLPTCWILEGLVMYLKKEEVKKLLEEMTGLSAKGSYCILNFLDGPAEGPANVSDMGEVLKGKGWSNEKIFFYGEKDFNYGRFPEGYPTSVNMGFSMYDFE